MVRHDAESGTLSLKNPATRLPPVEAHRRIAVQRITIAAVARAFVEEGHGDAGTHVEALRAGTDSRGNRASGSRIERAGNRPWNRNHGLTRPLRPSSSSGPNRCRAGPRGRPLQAAEFAQLDSTIGTGWPADVAVLAEDASRPFFWSMPIALVKAAVRTLLTWWDHRTVEFVGDPARLLWPRRRSSRFRCPLISSGYR